MELYFETIIYSHMSASVVSNRLTSSQELKTARAARKDILSQQKLWTKRAKDLGSIFHLQFLKRLESLQLKLKNNKIS